MARREVCGLYECVAVGDRGHAGEGAPRAWGGPSALSVLTLGCAVWLVWSVGCVGVGDRVFVVLCLCLVSEPDNTPTTPHTAHGVVCLPPTTCARVCVVAAAAD